MNKNSPVYLAIFLAITAALAGSALYAANSMTQPVILANAEKAEKASLLEMYPDASLDQFETVDAEAITADHPIVQNVYKYGDIVIFKCVVSGYDKGTTFLVAINAADGTIDNFKAIENGDTKGIGSKGDIVIFKCVVSGYDKGTTFLVAINAADGTIDNFKAIENGDTKGIGSKIMDQSFADSLKGKDAAGELDTISGATYTSTPVVNAINECAALAAQVD